MNLSKHLVAASITTVWALSAFAQNVTVTDAWARATVQGQKASGAFMVITAKENVRLVMASSSVAGIAEIHEMKMDKDVMRMSAVGALELPAGKAVELKPGGYHVMLMDLKNPLADKSTIPMTLTFEDAKGQKSRLDVQVSVRAMAAMSTHKH
jgi:copper(I)-binding protein